METLTLIVILAVMAVMMFFTSRASRRRVHENDKFRKSIVKGDQVMTGSGLVGVIESVDLDEKTVVINSEGSKSKWLIDAINTVPKSIKEVSNKSTGGDAKENTKKSISDSAKTPTKKSSTSKK